MKNLKVRFHTGRGSANHNSRKFDLEKADHIDQNLLNKNYINYGPIFQQNSIAKTNDIKQCELDLYEKLFSQYVQNQNARNIKSRHPERNRTIEDYYNDKKTCPVETILSVGNLQDGYVKGPKLSKIYHSYYDKFNAKFGKNIMLLDLAYHCDEQGADHVHERKIFIGHNSRGEIIFSKAAAFKELGIERPDMSKPESRNNCPLQTYTKICRDMFIEACIEHGISIDQEVKEYSSKSGLSTLQYKIQQDKELHAKLKDENTNFQKQNFELHCERDLLNDNNKWLRERNQRLEHKNKEYDELIAQKEPLVEALKDSAAILNEINQVHSDLAWELNKKARGSLSNIRKHTKQYEDDLER